MSRRRASDEPIRLGDAVAAVGKDIGIPPPDALASIVGAWPGVVGPALAKHSSVRSIRDGVCTINVDDPMWATELRYRESDLVERLRTVAGGPVVTSIRVVVGGPRKPLE